MSLPKLAVGLTLSAALSFAAYAQAPAPAPPKPDSPPVAAMVEKAKKTAGTQWADEEHFFCEAPRANAATDPPIAPTKIFDNLYAIPGGKRVWFSRFQRIGRWQPYTTKQKEKGGHDC